MKIGSAVLAVHVAVVFAFALTQGCVTTESQRKSRGAQHKGPFNHVHQGKSSDEAYMGMEPNIGYGDDLSGDPLYAAEPIDVAPIAAPPPVTPSSPTETYIVRKGDTLSQLAVDYDTTTAELVRINGLSNPDVLYVGQELRVPAGRRGSGGSRSSSSSTTSSIKKGGSYTIQKGDTLSEIASAAGVSIDALRQLNNIEGDMIRAGDTIDIPAGGKVPTTVQKTTTKKAEPKVEAEPDASELTVPEMAPVAGEADVAESGDTASLGVVEEIVLYPGQTLDEIALDYGISKSEIMRLNGITDESQVKEGQRLRIPIAE